MKKSNIARTAARSLVIVSLVAALALPATASAGGPRHGGHPAPAHVHHGYDHGHRPAPPPAHARHFDGGPRHGGHHHHSDGAAEVIGAVACTALGIGLLSALFAD